LLPLNRKKYSPLATLKCRHTAGCTSVPGAEHSPPLPLPLSHCIRFYPSCNRIPYSLHHLTPQQHCTHTQLMHPFSHSAYCYHHKLHHHYRQSAILVTLTIRSYLHHTSH